MRKILLALCCAAFCIPTAFAMDAYFPHTMKQGNAIQVLIPQHDMVSLQGALNKKPIKFFEVTQMPGNDENISRGAFLEHLLRSGDFSATTGSGTLFPDVPRTHPYAGAIYEAQALGLVNGYEDGNFHPYESLTRAQAAKILMLAFKPELTEDRPAHFTDLPYTHSLAGFMNEAIRAKLFQGYGDGTVKPDRQLRYSEAEILLERAAGKRAVQARATQKYWRGFIGIHRTSNGGETLPLFLQGKSQDGAMQEFSGSIYIEGNKYPTAVFSIPRGSYSVNPTDKYNKSWEMIDGSKKTTNAQQLWEGNFLVPSPGEISLGFGEKMIINGKSSGTHFGIDYAAPTGTPVIASNAGIVVLATETPYYGNTIVIDHGQNIFTMYLHLSAIDVIKDQAVKKGGTIGKVGSTGISTGPHLHFTHFVGDVIVDSEQWYKGAF